MSAAGLWRYRATLVAVTDGDTIRATIDLGFKVRFTDVNLRLLGLNAPEHDTAAGRAATAYVQQWCQLALQPQTAWGLLVETAKGDAPDKYGGRWDARIYRAIDQRCLNTDLIAAGHAVAWDGKGAKPT